VEARLDRRETAPAEHERPEIALEVEAPDLGGDPRIVEPLEKLGRDRRGPPLVIDQEHLLFEPDPPDAALDPVAREQLLQRADVAQECLRKDPQFRAVDL